MEWTKGAPFEPGGTRSPYAHRWLEQLDPLIRDRPDGRLDLPVIRPMEIVERNGHLTVDDPDAAAARAARPAAPRAGASAPTLAEIAALAAAENGPVPILLPDAVFNAHRTTAIRWDTSIPPPPATDVILVVIDDAIGFANERFRKGGRGTVTRFDYVWLQGVAGAGPSSLPFGLELDGATINALLGLHVPPGGGPVDESGLYRRIGYVDFRQSSVQSAASAASHGTAVADRAGGDGFWGPAGLMLGDVDNHVTLMGVCLPSQVIGDTAGTFVELFVILALERIRQRVRWLELRAGHRYPLVVNFSFSLTAGAQNRRGLLDSYLRFFRAQHHADLSLPNRPPVVFVAPAGNHRLARTHARIAPAAGAHPPLWWRLQPDDHTLSFVEIWSDPHPAVPAPTIHCLLRPPGVVGPLPVPAGIAFGDRTDLVVNGQVYAEAHYAWYPEDPANPAGPGRQRIVVSVNPTVADWLGQQPAPAGDWGVEIVGAAVPVDLRIQRDDSLAGYRQRGRQSYFVDSTYAEYDTAGRPIATDGGAGLVTRLQTVNQLVAANLPHVHVISAHARLWEWPAPGGAPTRGVGEMIYSGQGAPTRNVIGVREIADATLVHRGLATAGTLSGAAARVSGTSMAAPWAAREIAIALINWQPGTQAPTVIPPVPAPLGPVPRVQL
jgi:hypothetical protein